MVIDQVLSYGLLIPGDLHWKIVSVYIDRTGQVEFFQIPVTCLTSSPIVCPFSSNHTLLMQVVLKMKSSHVAGTITKKKKSSLQNPVSLFFFLTKRIPSLLRLSSIWLQKCYSKCAKTCQYGLRGGPSKSQERIDITLG